MANGNASLTKQVLIEFVVDDSQLDASVDTLAKTGAIDQQLANSFKQTTAEMNKQASALKTVAATTPQVKKGLADVEAQTKKTTETFLKGFEEGIVQELKKAGLTLDQFQDLLKKGPGEVAPANESLKKQLRSLTEELSRLKAAGQDNTEQYRSLTNEAGRLQDAIGDARAQIRAAASDTGVFDGMISAAQGITGAFAVAQGAAALFGDQSEELQKTLLKVNAAMAILQGLQQVQTVLQKESAASRLLDIIATKGQIAAQKLYTIVVGTSTGALKAFRIAMASTGIGLLIFGIIELVNALSDMDGSLEEVNEEIDRHNEKIEKSIVNIDRLTEVEVARAELAGAAESKIAEIRKRALENQRQLFEEENKRLDEQIKKIEEPVKSSYTIVGGVIVRTAEVDETYLRLRKATDENNAKIADINHKLTLAQIDEEKARRDENEKTNDDAKKKYEESAQKIREARANRLQEELAEIKRRLVGVEEGSVEELRIRQEVIRKQAQIDSEGEKLGAQRKALIREEAQAEQLKLERDFNDRLRRESIQAQIDRNNAELAALETGAEERLLLTISNIELASQLEVDAANGNLSKIKEINAKRDADIIAARKEAIEQALAFELRATAAANANQLRASQRLASDETKSINVRVAAINMIAATEIEAIDKRLDALQEEQEQRLISEQEYNVRHQELLNEREAATQDAEDKITQLVKSENEKRTQAIINSVKTVLDVANQVAEIFGALNALQVEGDKQRIAAEQQRIEELLKAGAITEKEAERRARRLDAEERRLRTIQAQRDKQAALFKALLQIPQAYLTGLAQGGPILAGIYAGLAAAEAGLIAARQVPKFFKGKPRGLKYEGPAEFGERGREILETEGRRYLAEKSTFIWVGKDDIIYNPKQTEEILETAHNTPKEILNYTPVVKNGNTDYLKVAKIIAKEISKLPATSLSLDKHGFDLSIKRGLERIHYMQQKYFR